MKLLINSEDFAINGENVTGSKLPFFVDDNSPYKVLRAHQNYGIIMATNVANRRFAPIITTIKNVFEEKPGAMGDLKEIYEEYCV